MALSVGYLVFGTHSVRAETVSGAQYLRDSREFYSAGQYFKAARYAFAANEMDASLQAEADAQITISLIRANLDNAASYFFIRTLQSGNKSAIRRVLTETQTMLVRVGGDIFRKYLIRHTTYEDYDALNRSAYLYALGKDALLSGRETQAVGYLNAISSSSPLWPFALQLRGSAFAIQGKTNEALADFESCQNEASKATQGLSESGDVDRLRIKQAEREAGDLKARCQAGEARTLYQADRFDEADQTYDQIAKASLVWPDILFEQAWNSFGQKEYNRTLGKLVSYKSPALSFMFNSEADVLRAQSYLTLCLYSDANEVINEFNSRYTKVGEETKRFIESNSNDLNAFYRLGAETLSQSLYTSNEFRRMINRFVRGPYFQNLARSEREVKGEAVAIKQFAAQQSGVSPKGRGFPGFLGEVLGWRIRAIHVIGGAFVKNSMLDYYATLIADFEKMAFIKLEMLSRAKDQLVYKNLKRSSEDRERGSREPSRRDYQYYWSFNGEFWTDELGDYVFGLESQCKVSDGG